MLFERRLALLLPGIMLISAVRAQGQNTVTVTSKSVAPNPPITLPGTSIAVSPFTGTISGFDQGKPQSIFCDDFFHSSILGVSFTGVITNIGQAIGNLNLLTSTRDGALGAAVAGGTASAVGSTAVSAITSLSQALTAYEQVAWLVNYDVVHPNAGAGVESAIQTAIWSISSYSYNGTTHTYTNYQAAFPTMAYFFSSGGSFCGKAGCLSSEYTASTNPLDTEYWVKQAETHYSDYGADWYKYFNVVTDVNMSAGPCTPTQTQYSGYTDPKTGTKYSTCSAQEYIVATPEPGTLALAGSGVISLFGVGFSRRRRSTKAVA